MNEHIEIITGIIDNEKKGIIIKFEDENHNKYHTYLRKKEIAAIICFLAGGLEEIINNKEE